ncbi:MAG: DUF1553 domain-containing protein [Rubripirellula sp.]
MYNKSSVCFLASFGLLVALPVCGQTSDQDAFFENRIRPVLVKHCYECHASSSKEPKGGLLLDTREGIRRGGDSGHGVVPGELKDSLVLTAMQYESMEMPPEGKLPDRVIADFEKWVRDGARDPRDGKSAPIRQEIDFERAREFWSFQPIADPSVPAGKWPGWSRTETDAFIAARLEQAGLRPVEDADGYTLGRRIYLDLIGLPPSPKQADEFANAYAQDADDAIGSLVDQLLDSPHFGERWGRHWMDVVRYAESTGMERNGTYPQAWRYRDWVIDAMNRDKPYRDFVLEQIAGDCLPNESHVDRDANYTATGLLALGPKSLNESSKEKFKMDVVDEQIDVVSRAFIGLTAACARCHDHKFDPIPQSEYYALAGIFASSETLYGTGRTNGNRNPGRVLALSGDTVKKTALADNNSGRQRKVYANQLKAAEKRLGALEQQLEKASSKKAGQAVEKKIRTVRQDIQRAKNRLKQVADVKQKPDSNAVLVMAMVEGDKLNDTPLRVRGEPADHGPVVPRGFLTIASSGKPPSIAKDSSGRLELAEWIVDPANPLTARVMVNRVWQHLFGRGLVATVNNFGANGDRPSHPQLLDHLATTFNSDGGSVKRLIRRIMTSRVYRLSSMDDESGLAKDPGNLLLWRMNQRRLEAEVLRDSMLFASGQIDLAPAQSSVVAKVGNGLVGRNIRPEQLGEESFHRSVYLPIVRGVVPEVLRVFDFPEPSIISGARDVTTVPTQALYMMNNPTVIQAAEKLAARLMETVDFEDEDRVRLAYRLVVSREPSAEEIKVALGFVDDVKQESDSLAWAGFCQSLFGSSEFRYLN